MSSGLKNKNKEDQIEGLNNYLYVEVSIECSRCRHGTYVDEIYGSEEAYNMGWRVIKNHCYCPKCAKKYLSK